MTDDKKDHTSEHKSRCDILHRQHEVYTNLLENQRAGGRSIFNISAIVLSIMIIGLGSLFVLTYGGVGSVNMTLLPEWAGIIMAIYVMTALVAVSAAVWFSMGALRIKREEQPFSPKTVRGSIVPEGKVGVLLNIPLVVMYENMINTYESILIRQEKTLEMMDHSIRQGMWALLFGLFAVVAVPMILVAGYLSSVLA